MEESTTDFQSHHKKTVDVGYSPSESLPANTQDLILFLILISNVRAVGEMEQRSRKSPPPSSSVS